MSQKNKQKVNQDAAALIEQEWHFVLSGKSADKLVQIIQSYEMDLLTNPIDKNPLLLQKYVWALLAAGDYLELKFLLKRTKEVKNKGLLFAIAEAGSSQNLKVLSSSVKKYLNTLDDGQISARLSQGTLRAVLNILSKYFITYKAKVIEEWLGYKQQDLKHLGYTVAEGFVQLKREEVNSECLMSKLKQLAVVATRMSKFE